MGKKAWGPWEGSPGSCCMIDEVFAFYFRVNERFPAVKLMSTHTSVTHFQALKGPFLQRCQHGVARIQTRKVERLRSTIEFNFRSYAERSGTEKCPPLSCEHVKERSRESQQVGTVENAAHPINIPMCENQISKKIFCCAIRQARKTCSILQFMKRGDGAGRRKPLGPLWVSALQSSKASPLGKSNP